MLVLFYLYISVENTHLRRKGKYGWPPVWPVRIWPNKLENFIKIIFFKFNFRLGLLFKLFKIPSSDATFCLPTGIQTGQFLKDTLTKIKSSEYVKLNFRWGLFSTKSSKKWVCDPLFPYFRFHFLASVIGMSTPIWAQCPNLHNLQTSTFLPWHF